MKSNNKIWWALSISIGVAAILGLALVVLFWHQSIQQNRPILQEIFARYGHVILIISLALIAGFGFMLARVFRMAIIPMNQLPEEVELIHSVNPAHRIQLKGAYGLMQLVEKINAGAEQYEKMEKSVFDRVHIAKAELEEAAGESDGPYDLASRQAYASFCCPPMVTARLGTVCIHIAGGDSGTGDPGRFGSRIERSAALGRSQCGRRGGRNAGPIAGFHADR